MSFFFLILKPPNFPLSHFSSKAFKRDETRPRRGRPNRTASLSRSKKNQPKTRKTHQSFSLPPSFSSSSSSSPHATIRPPLDPSPNPLNPPLLPIRLNLFNPSFVSPFSNHPSKTFSNTDRNSIPISNDRSREEKEGFVVVVVVVESGSKSDSDSEPEEVSVEEVEEEVGG